MFQSLAILFFSAALIAAFATLTVMLRTEWQTFTRALGLNGYRAAPGPLAPRYGIRPVRRSIGVRFEGVEARRRAAA